MTPQPPLPRRDFVRHSLVAGVGLAALSACSSPQASTSPSTTALPPTGSPTPSPTPAAASWAPRPQKHGGLMCVSRQVEDRLLVHTAGGDIDFWGGVTLGSTLPGRQEPTARDYRRWLPMMAQLGVRVIQVTEVHPPAFYSELLAYNASHPTAPFYLVQGVTLAPALAPKADDLYDSAVVTAARTTITQASGAVHGRYTRAASAAAPAARWRADVSPFTVAFVLRLPWSAQAIAAGDKARATVRTFRGRYVAATVQATPTESWIAARLDELATLEAALGRSLPIGFAGTPSTDPLAHPKEPRRQDDLVSIDTAHVFTTPRWPGGTFTGYDAHPYGPEFLTLQPDYQQDTDPYRAYLLDLKRHHRGVPTLITATGVGTALGSGDAGTNSRGQGHHTEQDAMQMNADLLRMLHDTRFAGGFLSAWQDDWSASTWNTLPRTLPVPEARRTLTHDPLTADQWMGLVAFDPVRTGERVVHQAATDTLQRITQDSDASWLYLTLDFNGRVTSPVEIGFDLLPGGGLRLPGGSGQPVHDVAVRMVPTMSTTLMYIRSALDPLRFDGLLPAMLPRGDGNGWNVQRLTLGRPRPSVAPGGPEQPAFLAVGELVLGSWDVADPDYNSLATWHLARPTSSGPARLRFRLPWSMLDLADASARTALGPSLLRPEATPVGTIDVTVESSTPGSPITFPLTWTPWNRVRYTERLKAGATTVGGAFSDVYRR